MNSIVFTHFVSPVQGPSCLDLALTRLGAWIDAEIGSLEDLLDISGYEGAIDDIEALYRLHLDADADRRDIERLLRRALPPLERLHDQVQTIPPEASLVGQAPSDFDAWVRWSGARLEDIRETLRRALAA